jgi:hypothetical protein
VMVATPVFYALTAEGLRKPSRSVLGR